MRKYFLGYLILGFLVFSAGGFGYRAIQYEDTLQASQKHDAYLSRLSSQDFETEDQIMKHLEHIKRVNKAELEFHQALNSIIKNMALVFLGCALIQAPFLLFLRNHEKSV